MASSVANQNVFKKWSNSNNLRIKQIRQALKEKNIQSFWNELSLPCKQCYYTHLHKQLSAEIKASLSLLYFAHFYISISIITLMLYFWEDITYIHILYTLYTLYLTSNAMFLIGDLQ